jgi:hypothetical protein
MRRAPARRADRRCVNTPTGSNPDHGVHHEQGYPHEVRSIWCPPGRPIAGSFSRVSWTNHKALLLAVA